MFFHLEAICASTTDNLAELAELAAPGDAAFFDGAEFKGADLRGTDLSRFTLVRATFAGARIDPGTKLPDCIPLGSYDREDGSLSQATAHIKTTIEGISNHILPIINNMQKALNNNNENQPRSVKSRSRSIYPPTHLNRKIEQNAVAILRIISSAIVKEFIISNDFSPKDLYDVINKLEKIIDICNKFVEVEHSSNGGQAGMWRADYEHFSNGETVSELGEKLFDADKIQYSNSKNLVVDVTPWQGLLANIQMTLLRGGYKGTQMKYQWSNLRTEYIKTLNKLREIHLLVNSVSYSTPPETYSE